MHSRDRHTGKWHQDIVRRVQHGILNMARLPAKHLTSGEMVQMQGQFFEWDTVAGVSERLIGPQGLFRISQPAVGGKKANIIDGRMLA